jgi:putative flippase GtrA
MSRSMHVDPPQAAVPLPTSAHRQFALFLVVGGIAAFANFATRILLGIWFDYATSIVLAYLVGMATAFVLNRVFVFSSTTNPLHHQMFWFVIVNLAAVLQTLAVSMVLARYVLPPLGFAAHSELIAHAAGVAFPVVSSYLGHKYLSFRIRT